jgi:hypothetical protein
MLANRKEDVTKVLGPDGEAKIREETKKFYPRHARLGLVVEAAPVPSQREGIRQRRIVAVVADGTVHRHPAKVDVQRLAEMVEGQQRATGVGVMYQPRCRYPRGQRVMIDVYELFSFRKVVQRLLHDSRQAEVDGNVANDDTVVLAGMSEISRQRDRVRKDHPGVPVYGEGQRTAAYAVAIRVRQNQCFHM